MPKFKDTGGREWSVEINVGRVKRVKTELGVDLLDLGSESGAIAELMGDIVRLVDVLFVLCREQAEREGVTDEQFGEALAGDELDQAVKAFTGALTDFFPHPRQREALARLLEAAERITTAGAEMVLERLEQIETRATKDLQQEIARGGLSTNLPGSPEQTPRL